MNEKNNKRISKFLCLLLRHQPQKIGLTLDTNGWATIEELIQKSKQHGVVFSFEELKNIVATNDKQRFSLNEDNTKIRANQGHSLKNVDVELQASTPPSYLYHGTVAKFITAIKGEGLQKMNRQHVHLSADRETATKVGNRRGKPIILTVRTGEMYQEGYEFFLSKNGVWLTDHVPSEYIEFKE